MDVDQSCNTHQLNTIVEGAAVVDHPLDLSSQEDEAALAHIKRSSFIKSFSTSVNLGSWDSEHSASETFFSFFSSSSSKSPSSSSECDSKPSTHPHGNFRFHRGQSASESLTSIAEGMPLDLTVPQVPEAATVSSIQPFVKRRYFDERKSIIARCKASDLNARHPHRKLSTYRRFSSVPNHDPPSAVPGQRYPRCTSSDEVSALCTARVVLESTNPFFAASSVESLDNGSSTGTPSPVPQPPFSGSPTYQLHMNDEEKKRDRRRRNNESAKRSRMNKKEKNIETEIKCTELEIENYSLKNEVRSLRFELMKLQVKGSTARV